MYKFNIILFLNFFASINAPDMEIPEQLNFKLITEANAIESFGALQLNQALPLVVFLDDMTGEFEPPGSLAEVFIDNGRIINGTQFAPVKPGEQIFFCPEQNSSEKCLVRREFQGLEPLQCEQEPKIIVQAERDEFEIGLHKCGFQNNGTSFSVVYDICSKPEHDYITKEIPVYAFCYDTNKKKTLFTNHGILFPQLLYSQALYREQSIEHSMENITEYIPWNYPELEAAVPKEGFYIPWVEKKDGYIAQKLVLPEDMPFALWKKPTYHYFNVELQHENLVDLWNQMNHYIRLDANNTKIRYCISTGVFDLNSKPRTDDQMSNVWVKIVYQASETPWESPSHALVILMDNFIEVSTDLASTSSNQNQNETDEYCEQNLCIDDLKEKFQKVGGHVRCCSLTPKMRELFGMEDNAIPKTLLNIPGINDIIVSD